jgi:GNAT superfamily N-acetyltransferase
VTARYVSVALTPDHDVSEFDCGVPSLNAWLREQALRAQHAGAARTFVWVTDEARGPRDPPAKVWAFFSLAPTEIVRAELTGSQAGGFSVVPGYLLARLAVHVYLRGHGYGSEVLVDALSRAYAAADLGGGRLIVVDAVDDHAASFYRHFNFTPVKGNPRRLVLKMETIRGLLGSG